jgi:hypothetical protein
MRNFFEVFWRSRLGVCVRVWVSPPPTLMHRNLPLISEFLTICHLYLSNKFFSVFRISAKKHENQYRYSPGHSDLIVLLQTQLYTQIQKRF